ncbi:GmrSD restriction endonuclease domain-containing protein [Helicobacter pylori]
MKTTIKEIFLEEGYSIPNYQRDYAWKDKNFRDLWEDLEEAIGIQQKGSGAFYRHHGCR